MTEVNDYKLDFTCGFNDFSDDPTVTVYLENNQNVKTQYLYFKNRVIGELILGYDGIDYNINKYDKFFLNLLTRLLNKYGYEKESAWHKKDEYFEKCKVRSYTPSIDICMNDSEIRKQLIQAVRSDTRLPEYIKNYPIVRRLKKIDEKYDWTYGVVIYDNTSSVNRVGGSTEIKAEAGKKKPIFEFSPEYFLKNAGDRNISFQFNLKEHSDSVKADKIKTHAVINKM